MSEIEVSVKNDNDETVHSFGITRADIVEILEGESDDENAVDQAADAVLEALANLDLGELAEWLVEQSEVDVTDYEDEDEDEG